jgi:hypothetical protein
MYELERFLKENENWEEILTGEPYYIKVKRDGSYVMFNYDQLRSDFSSILVQQSRGIIFRESTLEPVCVPFFKFFNAGELNAAELDWNTAFVTEKIDGSLMKVWWDGEWNISTNGTIDAFKADIGDVRMNNFGEYFINTLLKYYNNSTEFYNTLDEDKTYMFELVGPYNRVVVPYEEPDIYFLGARNKHTGEEFNCSPLIAGALGMGRFKLPKQYPLTSVNDCVKLAETFSWDQEGFVACDANFNRVKIKSPAYVLAHFARNNNVITKKHLIRVVLLNELEEFMCYAAEYKDSLEEVQKQINLFVNIGDKLAEACREMSGILSRPDYARLVKAMPDIYHGLLFCNYGASRTMAEYTAKWTEAKWEEYLELFEKYKERNWERE